MNYNESGSGYSLSDIAAVTGRNNNNDGFGEGSGWWIILLLLALGGWNNGFGGGFGGFGGGFGGGVGNEYAWLSNGQKEIMQNTNDGFNTLQLANQLTSVNTGVQNLSTQLCNCCADVNANLCNGFAGVNATVNSGFANAETAANARQMANMQQAFNNQTSMLQGFNGINSAIAATGCDIREGIAGVNYNNALQTQTISSQIASENCQDRAVLQEGIRDIIQTNTANTQAILDKLCQQEIDAKNETIANLRTQLNMADLRASQTAQNAFISQGFANEVDALYNRLNSCPVPTTPVYGRTPIFTCNNNGCGCGCGNNNVF